MQGMHILVCLFIIQTLYKNDYLPYPLSLCFCAIQKVMFPGTLEPVSMDQSFGTKFAQTLDQSFSGHPFTKTWKP